MLGFYIFFFHLSIGLSNQNPNKLGHQILDKTYYDPQNFFF